MVNINSDDIDLSELENNGTKKRRKRSSKGKIVKRCVALAVVLGLVSGGVSYVKNGGKLPKIPNIFSGITSSISNITSSKEARRATTLVNECTKNGVFSAPDVVNTDCAYATMYCDGENLVDAMEDAEVKYCEILDEYYTVDGRNIAVVTLEGERLDVVSPIKQEVGDTIMYFPPEGYELDGNVAVKPIKETVVRVVSVNMAGEPNYAEINDVRNFNVVDEKVYPTKTYDAIVDQVLIVDVPDVTKVTTTGYEGQFRLAPKRR